MNTTKQTLNNFSDINKEFLSYPKTLICMNIRSLRLNFTTFLSTINNILNTIKIIILVETNITDEENTFYNISSFNSVFLNRENRGGGIAVYIADHLNFNQINVKGCSLEIIQLDIEVNNKAISLLSVYRPPTQTFHRLYKNLILL